MCFVQLSAWANAIMKGTTKHFSKLQRAFWTHATTCKASAHKQIRPLRLLQGKPLYLELNLIFAGHEPSRVAFFGSLGLVVKVGLALGGHELGDIALGAAAGRIARGYASTLHLGISQLLQAQAALAPCSVPGRVIPVKHQRRVAFHARPALELGHQQLR